MGSTKPSALIRQIRPIRGYEFFCYFHCKDGDDAEVFG